MRFARQGEQEEISFQMAPMIDIVFQLLIFFACTFTFHEREMLKSINVPVADKSMEREEGPGELVVNIDREGFLTVGGGQPVTLPELSDVLEKTKAEFGAPMVLIRGDKDAYHGRILEVMNACRASGVERMSIATLPEAPPEGFKPSG